MLVTQFWPLTRYSCLHLNLGSCINYNKTFVKSSYLIIHTSPCGMQEARDKKLCTTIFPFWFFVKLTDFFVLEQNRDFSVKLTEFCAEKIKSWFLRQFDEKILEKAEVKCKTKWKNEKFIVIHKKFRQINSFVFSCQRIVTVNFFNFQTEENC